MPLYLRIYLAMLASLLAVAVLGAALWHAFGPEGMHRRGSELLARFAERTLPAAESPAAAQQAALERVARDLPGSVALYGADGRLIASVGRPPHAQDRWSFSSPLADGRVLVARGAHPMRRGGGGPGPLWIFAALLVTLAAGSYLVARRLTRRLERLQKAVDSLGTGELSARVPVEGRDEVARLAASFNRAAAQIEGLLAANRSLLANASHELRTPLARIRMALELSGEKGSGRTAEIARDIAELDTLIDEILLASRLEWEEMRPSPLALEDVDLLGLCAEEGARYEEVQVEGTSATVRGEHRLLRRLVRNLLENARRHGRPPVRVAVERKAGHLELRVRDAGEPLPPAERERIFEPFYRGLGLSIVRQIARRHGGDARYDDEGFVVTLGRNSGSGT